MNKNEYSHRSRIALGSLLTASCLALCAGPTQAQQSMPKNIGENAQIWDGSPGVPIHPDQTIELAMKIKQPFTAVGVGDLLEFQPFAMSNDPNVQYLVNIVRGGDVTTGDQENEIHDFDNFGHYGGNLATKEVADDWARMGIDLVSRANNKNQAAPGVWEDFKQVERVGIIHAGVAHSLPEARMARYFSTPKGISGFAGIYTEGGTETCCEGGPFVYVTADQLGQLKAIKDSILARRSEVDVPIDLPKPDAPQTVALYGSTFKIGPKPEAGTPEAAADAAVDARARQLAARRSLGESGRSKPGDGVMNTIHLTLYHGVTADQMAQLRAIAGDNGSGDLAAFGTRFRVMERPGEHSFDMDPKDEHEVLEAIRTGKQASDIMLTNVHWHQNRYDFQHYSYDHFPADFEIKLAHDAIDQGDDVFVAQGVHTIKGVEIYKGKPIFYGVSNFVFQSAIMPEGKGKAPPVPGREVSADGAGAPEGFGRRAKSDDPNGPVVGDHETQGFWQLKPNLEALLVTSHFEAGKLAEVKIYPVDLGQTPRPGSQVGIPRRPTPEVARKILAELLEYSKPFGTKISIENGVGVIHLAASAKK